MMRVLFFVEPVIFRGEPDHLSAHLPWARFFENAVHRDDGIFALASNPDICEAWNSRTATTERPQTVFSIDPIDPIVPFGYRRDFYAAALYGRGDVANPLKDALSKIRNEFAPDLVVMTSQNAYARSALAGLPILSIEKAPLPRHGHPQRMSFDIGGHQTNALLETRADEIRHMAIPEHDTQFLLEVIERLQQRLRRDPRHAAACAEIERIRGTNRVALLATQPPDWVTFDGAYQAIAVEELLCLWEEQLPDGWIGVPTYHPGFRLDPRVEKALMRSRKRLRFLPPELSQGLTEMLLTLADGIVSISSTVSLTGLLFGKSVVATGRSPFNAWCAREFAALSEPARLTSAEAASTLAFLTNRYSWLENDIEADPTLLSNIAKAAQTNADGAWFFDFKDWSHEQTNRLFDLS